MAEIDTRALRQGDRRRRERAPRHQLLVEVDGCFWLPVLESDELVQVAIPA
jgi:hypothetical protein